MRHSPTAGIVAAGHPQTAEAGKFVLQEGGNAFDAAIAAVLAACVVESSLTSLGGGGFLLAHTQKQENLLFDFFCQTPAHKKPLGELDFYPVALNFGDSEQTFHIGKGAIGVPGVVAGLFAVHRRLGSLPFSVLSEPAIHYARQGFVVNDFIAFTYRLLAPILTQGQENQQVYAPQGRLLQAGERGFQPQMANTLEYLVQKGAEAFYQGDLAQHWLSGLAEGGYLTSADLAAYRVQVRTPLQGRYRSYQLLTNPAPSSGGPLMAFALQLLEHFDLQSYPLGSPAYIALLSRVMALTNEARQNHYDATLYDPQQAIALLHPEKVASYHQRLTLPFPSKLGSTTHISVVDGLGNAASVTTSNGEGSSYTAAATGVMLNNMLGEADLNPGGFHLWPTKERLSSMMAPTLILADGKPRLVLGSGGSNRIRTALLQVICHCLDYHLPLQAAIDQPRLHWENRCLDLEPGLGPISPQSWEGLEIDQVKIWQDLNMFFGGVHGVGLEEGQLLGAGDPRRSGAVACQLHQ